MTKKNPHWGTTLDSFLAEDGIRKTAKAEALTRTLAWQPTQEMERQGITKAALAERMHTSRAQIDRILKAKGNVTVETLQRATTTAPRSPARTHRRRPPCEANHRRVGRPSAPHQTSSPTQDFPPPPFPTLAPTRRAASVGPALLPSSKACPSQRLPVHSGQPQSARRIRLLGGLRWGDRRRSGFVYLNGKSDIRPTAWFGRKGLLRLRKTCRSDRHAALEPRPHAQPARPSLRKVAASPSALRKREADNRCLSKRS